MSNKVNKQIKIKVHLNVYFPKRIEHFKNTKDNWYDNYKGNQVILTYHGIINPYVLDSNKFIYRVSVWGNDDLGIDKDFNNHLEAKQLFNKINSLKYVNKQDLLDLGMEYF